jgi:hypothetical protein
MSRLGFSLMSLAGSGGPPRPYAFFLRSRKTSQEPKAKSRVPHPSSPTPKSRGPGVTPSARLRPTKQALPHVILRQMGWLGPSTSLPEDFNTWPVVLVVLSS